MFGMSAIRKAAVGTVLIMSVAGLAFAHSGASGVVKKRMDSMKSIAGSMKAISKLDWAKLKRARAALEANAGNIGKHASHMVKMFPDGSIEGPSEAMPAIWERPDEFSRLADLLKTRASELEAIASDISSAAEIKPHIASISETCKSCHEGFRQKK